MPRPLNKIAAEIDAIMHETRRNTNPCPAWVTHSRPYVSAMLSMKSFKEWYGIDSGVEIGQRFLHNAHSWRGDAARRIKAELNELLKEANAHYSSR